MSESSDQQPKPEDRYLEKMRGIIRSHTHQERVNALFLRIKARLPELEELARDLEEAEEDGVYRFYRRVASSTRHGGGALPF
jgi:Lon protease-like protein